MALEPAFLVYRRSTGKSSRMPNHILIWGDEEIWFGVGDEARTDDQRGMPCDDCGAIGVLSLSLCDFENQGMSK